MSNSPRDFIYSDSPEPHRERTRAILQKHPDARALIGRNPYSFLLILLVLGMQTTIAFLLRDQAWWLAVVAAYLVGAFANHSLYVLIHEAAHNLIFKGKVANILSGILADLPNTVPGAASFRSYHLKHHSFQGDYYLDADLANRWEARLIGSSFIGKTIWLFFFPVFQALRPLRLKEIPFMNIWTVLNWVTSFSYDLCILFVFGPVSFLYLFTSLFFAIGLHPLGARWIQEHYLTTPPQETYSYYGPLNILALNVGYHNEHHDLPSVPWNHLPKLKDIAPEAYETLVYHTSWGKLLWRFLTDSNLSLYSRVVRSNREGVPRQA